MKCLRLVFVKQSIFIIFSK